MLLLVLLALLVRELESNRAALGSGCGAGEHV